MIPLVATVRVRPAGRSGANLWLPLPLFLVWLVLLPLAVLLLPLLVIACLAVGAHLHHPDRRRPGGYFLAIACLAVGVHPLRTLSGLWHLLSAFHATEVEIVRPESSIHVHIT